MYVPEEDLGWGRKQRRRIRESDDPKVRRLNEAAADGAFIEVRDHGGDRPGVVRAIRPHGVFQLGGDDKHLYLHAFCRESDDERAFRLDQLELLDGAATPDGVYGPAQTAEPEDARWRPRVRAPIRRTGTVVRHGERDPRRGWRGPARGFLIAVALVLLALLAGRYFAG
jgi:hypothetical protein